ncbi:AI-2E family transporter, partial [Xanthovirga aplysinae]|uniref:AI-2E family transporter n=1 Tax=Xanthovirga aplysinae TaxID=2529853 RepID=UPI0012BB8E56
MNKKLIYLGLIVAVFFALIYVFSNIFIYLCISIVLASILRPLTNYISQVQFFYIRIPRILSVFLSFVVLILVLSFFILLFVPLVAEQIEVLSTINYDTLFETMVKPFEEMEHFLIAHNLTNEEYGFIVDNIKNSMVSFLTGLDVTSLLNNILSFTGSFFIGLLAVTFITFVLLYEKDFLQKKFIALVPNQYFEISIAAVYKI